jgi:hypothetical protein
MIHFQCHACGAHLRAKESQAGQSFGCAKCGTRVDVPDVTFLSEPRDTATAVNESRPETAAESDWWSDVPSTPPPDPLPALAPETSEAAALALPPPDPNDEAKKKPQDVPRTKLGKIFPDLDDPVKRKVILPGAAMIFTAILSLMLAVLAVPTLMVSLYLVMYRPESYDACATSGAMLWTIGCGIYYAMALVRAVHMLLLTDREQAMIGAMMMLVPCGPCWLLGLPTGLWALSALRDEQVRRAFKK